MQNRRDALHFAIPSSSAEDDGAEWWPVYRMYNTAYNRHARSTETRAGTTGLHRARRMPPWMRELMRVIEAQCLAGPCGKTQRLNHVVLHRYLDSGDGITKHRDKDLDMDPQSSIVTLSLGATRTFRLFPPAGGKKLRDIHVADGDVVVLPLHVNRGIKHGIVPCRAPCGVRYSLTCRTMDTYYCPERRVLRTRSGWTTGLSEDSESGLFLGFA
jgi:hypothetical protein